MRTYLEHFREVAAKLPNKVAISRWSPEARRASTSVTFFELCNESSRLGNLLAHRFEAGSRVLISISEPIEFAMAFLACWQAGLIPVPVSPPTSRTGDEVLKGIAQKSRAVCLGHGEHEAKRLDGVDLGLPRFAVGRLLAEATGRATGRTPSAIALLQFTSGSSGSPKGVVLTHENLLTNEAMLTEAWDQSSEDRWGSWLPLYHDMGLITGLLQPLFNGSTAVMTRPAEFVASPATWLELISRMEVTASGAPNFAFDLLVRRYRKSSTEGLDLSRWRLAFNGAEPIRERTLNEFSSVFKSCGFDQKAFLPCYGMAEATVFVSGWLENVVARPRRPAFDLKAGPERSYMPCGRPGPGLEVAVVEPQTHTRVSPGEIGEIWLRGRNLARQYFELPDVSRATFDNQLEGAGPYLRTGDLGFVSQGEIVITGRLKDVIPYRGRSIHAVDVEAVIQAAHEATLGVPCAAFEVNEDDLCGIGVVAEFRKDAGAGVDRKQVAQACELALLRELDLKCAGVVLIDAGQLPMTTSGKVRRQRARDTFWPKPSGSDGKTERSAPSAL